MGRTVLLLLFLTQVAQKVKKFAQGDKLVNYRVATEIQILLLQTVLLLLQWHIRCPGAPMVPLHFAKSDPYYATPPKTLPKNWGKEVLRGHFGLNVQEPSGSAWGTITTIQMWVGHVQNKCLHFCTPFPSPNDFFKRNQIILSMDLKPPWLNLALSILPKVISFLNAYLQVIELVIIKTTQG